VDGAPASILAPGPAYFTVSQNLRAATYRLDLELTSPLADTSGDGIPDWWKTLYGITGILFALSIPFVWMKFGAGYGLFMLLNLWLPLSSGAFEGVGRYCSVLFPAFLCLATIQSRTASTAIIVLFSLFYTLGLALFTTIHPIF